tara:strand:- start:391 stop:540 length:150 start_codon:yes stop_codon:yes gene_type:complete
MKYVAHYDAHGHEVINANDDMEAAYIAQYWARIRGAELKDVQPIEDLNG